MPSLAGVIVLPWTPSSKHPLRCARHVAHTCEGSAVTHILLPTRALLIRHPPSRQKTVAAKIRPANANTRSAARNLRVRLLLTDNSSSPNIGACPSINAPTRLTNATHQLAASGCKLSSTAWRLRGVLHFGTSPDQGSSAALARPSPSGQALQLWYASCFFYSGAVFHLRSLRSHIRNYRVRYSSMLDMSMLVVMSSKMRCHDSCHWLVRDPYHHPTLSLVWH